MVAASTLSQSEKLHLAKLLFPDVKDTPDNLYKKYPDRGLDAGKAVTRFAPSPTGFMHIGSVFAALVAERVAHTTGGVFCLRIEDTDSKREVEGGITQIVGALDVFKIKIDEGVVAEEKEVGKYGPYKQSERIAIYHVFGKLLVEQGFAYPCFFTSDELDEIHLKQAELKVRFGFYGEWAKNRDLGFDEIKTKLDKGVPWVLRLRAGGTVDEKTVFEDLVKGKIDVTSNDQDIVLLKSDGIPTYHFAHVVDDHLMGTTHVIRADEWLPSLPVHLELFKDFGWKVPHYAHVSPIMKIDESGTKRKLSKRKDHEANVEFYWSTGFPPEAVIEYLLNIANSGFEDWRKANPETPYNEFPYKLNKMNVSGALFDLVKLTDVSKNVIAKYSAEEVYAKLLEWAENYDRGFAVLLKENRGHALKIFNIERTGEKIRKDIGSWNGVLPAFSYFYEHLFEKGEYKFPEKIADEDVKGFLKKYLEVFDMKDTKEVWFSKIRSVAMSLNYAGDMKAYKENPGGFRGSVSDAAMILRVALTKRTNTPELYEIIHVLGEEVVLSRLKRLV